MHVLRVWRRHHLLFAALTLGAPLAAQPPASTTQAVAAHMAEGDRQYDARNPQAAITAYEAAAFILPTHYDALWKAARSATDLGEFEKRDSVAHPLFARARALAERAIKADSTKAEAYFQLSRAIGRLALTLGPKDRVRYAADVRTSSLTALAHDPEHPGALHVIGVWNAEIMRLSGFERLMAKTFLGGKVLSVASWDSAAKYLERSSAAEPARIVHRLDLGLVYKDTKKAALARTQFEWIARAPVTDFNDPNYKRLAAEALRGLK